MSGGFYLNGREISDNNNGEGPSTSYQASSSHDPIATIRENIRDASRVNNFEACLDYCSEALRVSPESKEFSTAKAMYLVLTHQLDKANEILSEILKFDAQNAKAISILGLIFYHQGNIKKSIEVFSSALEINPGLNEAIAMRDKATKISKILQNIPDAESSKEKFTGSVMRLIAEGLAIDPSNKEVTKTLRFYRGLGHFKNGRFQSAVDDFTETLKHDPANVNLFMLRAKSYKELALPDDAIIDLKEADKLNKYVPCRKVSNEIEDLRKAICSVYVPKTNYELLEVSRNATDIDMTVSFKSLTILYKVNLSKASTDAEKRKLEFFYRRIESAYAILSDKKVRAKYDKMLEKQEASIECPKCCTNIGQSYLVCCNGCGACADGLCTGFGNCFRGLGSCISGCCCSEDGLNIICKSLNCANIIIAFIILFILYLIFK